MLKISPQTQQIPSLLSNGEEKDCSLDFNIRLQKQPLPTHHLIFILHSFPEATLKAEMLQAESLC